MTLPPVSSYFIARVRALMPVPRSHFLRSLFGFMSGKSLPSSSSRSSALCLLTPSWLYFGSSSTGEFEMTTASQNNSFVKDGFLYIVPTLTSDSIGSSAIFDGTVYNITGCTFNQTRPNNGFTSENGATFFDESGYLKACSAVSNRTAGTVINPVQSARINTKGKASIRYGRVEIKAKMPNGLVPLQLHHQWLQVYLSSANDRNLASDWVGHSLRVGSRINIDSFAFFLALACSLDASRRWSLWVVASQRGNRYRWIPRKWTPVHCPVNVPTHWLLQSTHVLAFFSGSNYVQGSLNWGPTTFLNGVSKSYSWWTERRRSFGSNFRTYVLEWTDKWL